MDCFGTAISMGLQYGVPLEVYVNKFAHTRFETLGFTKNPKFVWPRVSWIISSALWAITFLPGYREAHRALPAEKGAADAGGDDSWAV